MLAKPAAVLLRSNNHRAVSILFQSSRIKPTLFEPITMSRGKKQKRSQFTSTQQNGELPEETLSNLPLKSTILERPAPKSSDLVQFRDLMNQNVVHPELLQTIVSDLKFETMSPIQAATFRDLLDRHDCLAQARTGTGKTLAFLLPTIQHFLIQNRNQRKPGQIYAMIVSPTRELAMQIAAEAKSLLQRFPQVSVKLAIGGTSQTQMAHTAKGCDILVGTPGRLIDHLGDEDFQHKLSQVQVLVLDEADRMLDMGFLPSIKQIIAKLPNKENVSRQSMLFSATMGNEIHNIARLILNKDYKFISTIPKGEMQTHERVPQIFMRVPTFSDLAPALVSSLRAEMGSAPQFKAIVFAGAARLSDFYGHVLGSLSNLPPVSVLHSRLSQSRRTKITNDFRESQNAICVATDVIARGMDFPDVTHVFQVGLPMDRDSYIHRLGRTARADGNGRGIFILAEPEIFFLRLLADMKFQETSVSINETTISEVRSAAATFDNKAATYQAFLGYYKTFLNKMQWTPRKLVDEANVLAIQALGCEEIPGIQKSTIGKMGLKGVPGLVILANAAVPNKGRPSASGSKRKARD